MTADAFIAPLRIANEAFMVASTIERCPRQMMLRELVMNALEAAAQATDAPKTVRIDAVTIDDAPKLRIWNTGRGLSQAELLQISELSSSLFKTVSLDGNFGMGAKAASLASNKHGLRYRSCRLGKVSQIVLGARGGVYGRVLQEDPAGGERREAIDVTAASLAAGEDVSHDWTEVTLFGNSPEQDTAADPYAGDPALPRDWIARTLGRRFMRLPEGVELTIEPAASGAATREIFTPPLAPASFDRFEAVRLENGVVIHYGYRAKDSAAPPPRVNVVGAGAVVYDGEVYALTDDRRWALEAPTYGFTFAAKLCSVVVELPHGFGVRPEQYRQFLRFNDGDQHQAQFADFGDLVRRNLPVWMKRIIAALMPAESDYLSEIREEMRHLLAELGLEEFLRAPRPPRKPEEKSAGDDKPAPPRGESALRPPRPPDAPKPPEPPAPPEIITIEDEAEIVEKALGGRVARYYPAARQVFVNARYAAFARIEAQLADEFAPFADEETVKRAAKLTAEWTVIQRVARSLLHSIGKPKAGWTADEIKGVQSPETMSLMVDDIDPLLVPARRRMAAQLGLEPETQPPAGSAADPAQRAAGELAEAEAQLQRAMARDGRNLGRFYLQVANFHASQRDVEAQRAWLEKGMAADPDDPWCRSGYASLLLADKDFDRAAQFADQAIALAPENASFFRRRRADVELRRGHLDQAEAMLAQIAADDPESPWPHYDLVGLHLRQGKLDAAAAAAAAAAERSPDDARFLQRRADVELRRGDRAAARALYDQALTQNPDDAQLRLALAKLHTGDGRFDEATRELDAALALRPAAQAPFHRAQSDVELQRGRRASAIVAAQRAVRADPADPWGQIHLAGVFQAVGDLDAAAAALAEAERVAPEPWPHIYLRQAELEGRRGNPAGAVTLLERALALTPDDAWIWLSMSAQKLAQNDLAGADEAAKTAGAKLARADQAPVLRRRAQIASRRKDDVAAAALLREAVEIAPKDPWARLAVANLLLGQGDLDAALANVKEAIALSAAPNAAMLIRAAFIEERQGHLDAARDYLRQAIAVDPDDPQPWSSLMNVLNAAGDVRGAREAGEKAVQLASGGREPTEAAVETSA